MASARFSVALAVVCALFATTVLAGPLLQLGSPPWLVALVVAGAALLAGALAARRGREREGSAWDLVPSRQYAGRHVESGGLTRDEQERALEEIQEQASRTERD